jgi:hypothetical protein
MAPEPGESVQRICIGDATEGCDACDSDAVAMEAENQVAGTCGYIDYKYVACGPIEMNEVCCYDVVFEQDADDPDCQGTIGRPFLIEGRARLADLADEDAWADQLRPSLVGLGEQGRRVLAEQWARDGLDEHASVAAFARHVMELMALGAPPELVQGAQQALADEIAHARACFGLASAYAGRSVGPGAMSMQGAMPAVVSEEGVLEGLIREGCVGETLASLMAAEARDAARDPVLVRVLDAIVEEEAQHAQLAWATLRWMLDRGDEGLRQHARRVFADALSRVGSERGHVDESLRTRGRLSAAEKSALAQKVAREVITPAANAVLATARAA